MADPEREINITLAESPIASPSSSPSSTTSTSSIEEVIHQRTVTANKHKKRKIVPSTATLKRKATKLEKSISKKIKFIRLKATTAVQTDIHIPPHCELSFKPTYTIQNNTQTNYPEQSLRDDDFPDQYSSLTFCNYCKRMGHEISACRTRARNNRARGRGKRWHMKPYGSSDRKFPDRC